MASIAPQYHENRRNYFHFPLKRKKNPLSHFVENWCCYMQLAKGPGMHNIRCRNLPLQARRRGRGRRERQKDVCVCARACVRVRACVRAYVCACARARVFLSRFIPVVFWIIRITVTPGTIVYSSITSATCFGLKDHHQVELG